MVARKGSKFNFSRWLSQLFLLGGIIVGGFAMWLNNTLLGVLIGTVINSLLTMICYKADKAFALQKDWRIPEINLHGWELLWGWPGALWAQRMFRHKNAKGSYQVVFWLCVILNCVGSYWLIKSYPTIH